MTEIKHMQTQMNKQQVLQFDTVPSTHAASHSSDRSKETDHKTLRRLAQNREAARKSRLRKKVYTLRNAPYASEEIDVVREQWAKFFTSKYLLLA
ncbi:transcription factor TGA5-like isoform X1 [Spinacia oleracea]|uniref:Transcription factor TGA5-like isoform X1 n=1 Tax=Spinacia oleracea TaxID=3562 RepID=A0ABM3QJ79_SPIOL|nr:transcription factor TGA5-like isoform X1 [Spinacia oleracea]XP_056683413.1 transcription factor TGA5-like isoform X1 [Spinacia oleracea]XP_056683414.1 transcription factor TGA5-like isoform X1 [Spinacia oleracea]XP_056683415.1 transcription factor TGA5-like isoform X1 [Spinacia oleracea]XP_056683416.1 transcription factor TGA5-like isoform X1 [Spinacia oleracea]